MIKFQCGSCGKKIGVPDTAAGKRVRCPQCQAVEVVPPSVVPKVDPVDFDFDALSDLAAQEPHVDAPVNPTVWTPLPAKKRPPFVVQVWTSLTLGTQLKFAAIVLGLCILAGWLMLRDTWERDNLPRLTSQLKDAKRFQNDEQFEQAVQTYSAVLDEASRRVNPSRELEAVKSEAESGISQIRQMQKDLLVEGRLRPQVEVLQSEAESLEKSGRLADAKPKYQAIVDLLGGPESRPTTFMTNAFDNANDKVAAITASVRLAQSVDAANKGLLTGQQDEQAGRYADAIAAYEQVSKSGDANDQNLSPELKRVMASAAVAKKRVEAAVREQQAKATAKERDLLATAQRQETVTANDREWDKHERSLVLPVEGIKTLIQAMKEGIEYDDLASCIEILKRREQEIYVGQDDPKMKANALRIGVIRHDFELVASYSKAGRKTESDQWVAKSIHDAQEFVNAFEAKAKLAEENPAAAAQAPGNRDDSAVKQPTPEESLATAKAWRDEQVKVIKDRIGQSNTDEESQVSQLRQQNRPSNGDASRQGARGTIWGAPDQSQASQRNKDLADQIRAVRKQFQDERTELGQRLVALKGMNDATVLQTYQGVVQETARRQEQTRQQEAQREQAKQAMLDRQTRARALFNWNGKLAYCPTCVMPKISAVEANFHNGVLKVQPNQMQPDPNCPTCGGTGWVPAP